MFMMIVVCSMAHPLTVPLELTDIVFVTIGWMVQERRTITTNGVILHLIYDHTLNRD